MRMAPTNRLLVPVLIVGVLFAMSSCTLDSATQDGVKAPSVQNPLIEDNALLQRFTINSARDTIISGLGGTQVTFKADPSASTGDQDIEVDLREYYSIGQCLMSGLSTTSSNRILETSGMIRLEASSSDPSRPIPDLRFRVSMHTRSGRDVSIFSGRTDSTGRIDWSLDPSIAINHKQELSFPEPDSAEVDSISAWERRLYNTFETTNLGWINCDRFVEFDNLTDVSVSVKDHPPGTVYSLVLMDRASIIAGRASDGALHFLGVPSGLKACVVALSIDENDAMSVSMLDIMIDHGSHEMPELVTKPREEIKQMLETKFGALVL